MAKSLRVFLIMLALTVSIVGGAWAGCIEPIVAPVVSQEAACTCYYNDGNFGQFGTLFMPPVIYELGVTYACYQDPPIGNNAATITFILSATDQGNCSLQHNGVPGPYPKFWNSGEGDYYLQVKYQDPNTTNWVWSCKDASGKDVWKQKSGTGHGFNSVTFEINTQSALMAGNTVGYTLPVGMDPKYIKSPFLPGVYTRLSNTCTGDPEVSIDDCTLCTNCSYVKITKTGTATCPTNSNYDPVGTITLPAWATQKACLVTTYPVNVFKSMNQFSTTIVPGVGFPMAAIHNQFIGKVIFNGIVNVYYSPDVSKSRTGFTNAPQSWDVVDNYTDMGCFWLCSNANQICGDYCCWGSEAFVWPGYLITEDASFKFDVLATQKWNAGDNTVKAWVGDKFNAFKFVEGVRAGGAAPLNTDYNMWFDLNHRALETMGWDVSMGNMSYVAPVCVFAQTQRDKVIQTRSFSLDYAKLVMPSQRFDLYFPGGIPILPPDGKRWMGAWKLNGFQATVAHFFTSTDYFTRCFLSNKTDRAVQLWVDLTAVGSCIGLSETACLDKLGPLQGLSLGTIPAQSVKYANFDYQIQVFEKEALVMTVPLPGLDPRDRYSVLFTFAADPTDGITNVGSALNLAIHGANAAPAPIGGANWDPTKPQQYYDPTKVGQYGVYPNNPTWGAPGDPEVYAGVPIGPAYEPFVQIMCIQKDGRDKGFRTIPVAQGSWNANPWQQ